VTLRWADVGVFAGVDEGLSDVTKFLVEVLRCSPQDVKGVLSGDAFALHQDPLGLSDHLAGHQRTPKMGAVLVRATSIHGRIERLPGQCGQDRRFRPVMTAIGVSTPGLQVERTLGAIDEQSVGEGAADAGCCGLGAESNRAGNYVSEPATASTRRVQIRTDRTRRRPLRDRRSATNS
jgi:hypothetical protein